MLEKVKEILANHLSYDVDEIELDSELEADLGADSLDMVEIAMDIEEEFGIDEIPDEVYERIHTVGDIIDYLEELDL